MPGEEYIETYVPGEIHIGRLKHGDDLLAGILALCTEKNIQMGAVQAIGALSTAKVAYYHQNEKKYQEISLDGHYEIVSLIGNISLKDGVLLCHAHIVLGDETGNTQGGHLVRGCTVFACEVIITALKGKTLQRGYDEMTGLPLWNFKL